MARKILTGSINLSKIDKANLFKTDKGAVYLDFKVVFGEQEDQYGNIAFVAQTFLKDNRKDAEGNYIQTPILGNLKEIKAKDAPTDAPPTSDLPF